MYEVIVKDEELLLEMVRAGDQNAISLYKLFQLTSNLDSLSYRVTASTSGVPSYEINSAATFGKCVVNKFVNSYGSIARQFLTGAIFYYIKTKQYDLAARLMFKTLVKAGFKVNAVSLAIEAAIYGWQCRNKW